MARINWIGQSSRYKASTVGDLRLLNGYSELVESKQGKSVICVYGTPGLRRFCTLPGGGAVRGLYTASNGRCFAVQGSSLYELLSDGTEVMRGTPLWTAGGPVDMTDNGTDLVLVDGENGYHLTFADNTFAAFAPADFPGATRCGFLDGYLVFNHPLTQQFYWTDLYSLTIDPLSFASAEGSPDLLMALAVLHRELWLVGATTTEVWLSDGSSPFVRSSSGFLEQGTEAPHSLAQVGDVLCWLSRNAQGQRMVVQAQGYQVQRISTHAVEQAIQHYGEASDALGWGQQWEGHPFYWLTFPTAGVTWVYDFATQLWHERGALVLPDGTIGQHRASCATFAFGQHLVGDYQDGRVYVLDDQVYSDDGLPQVLRLTFPPFFDDAGLKRIQQTRLQVDCVTGVGLDGGVEPGRDPQIVLELSNDGGQTWGPMHGRSLGRLGQTKARVQWHQLGAAFDRRCRLSISDPVKRVILGAVTDVQVLG